mmetsp:Transcript_35690/g.45839  ORF Transcript_35690/g.45839 Transcript_35690/m.45839 type:complete len:497 (-) Transcript_35690:212-1702(-)
MKKYPPNSSKWNQFTNNIFSLKAEIFQEFENETENETLEFSSNVDDANCASCEQELEINIDLKNVQKVGCFTLYWKEFYGCFPPKHPRYKSFQKKTMNTDNSLSKKGLSAWSATITLLKSFVGTYLLYLPHMFQEAGLAFSLTILGMTAALSLFNMHLLLDCCQAEKGETFGLIAKNAFGSWAKFAVDFSITVSQMSYCIAYFTYVAQNLQTYFPHYSLAFLMSIQLFLYIPLCSLRHLRFLSPFVLVANFCMFTGLFGVLYYFGVELFGNGPQAVRLINPSFMFIFVGSVSMSFEGTILVIPTYEAMSADAQKHFRKIITGVMLFLFIFFACFAGLGYLAYGDGVQRFITLNLPEHSPVGSIVKIGYMISIVVMFPLMMYPVSRLLERIVFGEKKVKKRTFFQKWRRLLIRSCFRSAAVVFILGAAMYLNAYYDHFNAVVGSVCVCPLALLYPAMFHIKLFSDKNSIKKNISLIATIIYGVTAIILSLAVTTITW